MRGIAAAAGWNRALLDSHLQAPFPGAKREDDIVLLRIRTAFALAACGVVAGIVLVSGAVIGSTGVTALAGDGHDSVRITTGLDNRDF